MRLSLRKSFFLMLGTAIASSFILSGLALYFNFRIVENQQYLLETASIYNARHKMNAALSGLLLRQQNILLANNFDSLSKIPMQIEMSKRFEDGFQSLSEISNRYPMVNKSLGFLYATYQVFLLTDQELFELKKSELLMKAELNKKVEALQKLLLELREKIGNISGKLTLQTARYRREIVDELDLPKLLDSRSGQDKFKLSVGQLIISDVAYSQEISANLNTDFSELSGLIRQLISETNQDQLRNLENNQLPQLFKIIRNELEKFKTKTKTMPELNQSVADIDLQFESIASEVSEAPNQNLLALWHNILLKEETIKENIEKIHKMQNEIIKQFDQLDIVMIDVRDMLLEKSQDIILKSRILMTSIVLIVLITLMIFGSFLMRALKNSLNTLTNTMRKISKEESDLSYRIEEMPFEELNEVRQAFNTMAEKLQFIYSHLEELVKTKTLELSDANNKLELDVQHRIEMEKKVAKLNQELMETARLAGMADVAASVLHNIGNILNSVVVSLALLQESFKNPDFKNLLSVISMINANLDNISQFFTEDEKGKLIPKYLVAIGQSLNSERTVFESEVKSLRTNVKHIEDIVMMQQSVGGKSVISERIFLPDIIEMAIQISGISSKNGIAIEKNFQKTPFIVADKSKLVQIILNLILNAKDALTTVNYDIPNKTISIEINESDTDAYIIIRDNGIGVLAENITKIFSFGFTTKIKGHGFGLHSSALAAKELGGDLQVASEGAGQGSAFTLTLPLPSGSGERNHESNS